MITHSHERVWQAAQQALQGMLNTDLFTRWFAPIRALEIKEDTLVLGVANEFSQIWLQDNFQPLVGQAVNQNSKTLLKVKFIVDSNQRPAQLPAPASKTSAVHVAPVANLSPRNTFDAFVVGPNNNFAHAAALAVAQTPAKAYNPLFMYGGVGLGKTHLMQAIGHCAVANNRTARVCYVTSEQFLNEYIQAIQAATIAKFRKKYRQVDVLLIDDIQFLGGKERMQDEFFHTFNSLFDGHKQIVLSSDRPAAEIEHLESRLVSRFEWGLVAELQPPALETRIAILKKKSTGFDVKIPDTVIEYLAERIRTNVRRLEGALTRLAAYASINHREITIEMVETVLHDALHEEAKHTVTVDRIQQKVAEYFDIRLADMTSRRRPQNVAFPRQVAMYLSRTMTDRSLMDIGDSFGGRDHGTILHACRQIETKMRADSRLRQAILHLQTELQR